MSVRSTYSVSSQAAIAALELENQTNKVELQAANASANMAIANANAANVKNRELEERLKAMEASMNVYNVTTLISARGGRGGRGSRSARGGRGGRGALFVSSLSQPDISDQVMTTKSKKRASISEEIAEKAASAGKFWTSGDSEVDNDTSFPDPREAEGFKISRIKGFMKDRNDKQNATKKVRMSKTQRRNSKEPLVSQTDEPILDMDVQASTLAPAPAPTPTPVPSPAPAPVTTTGPGPSQTKISFRDKVLAWETTTNTIKLPVVAATEPTALLTSGVPWGITNGEASVRPTMDEHMDEDGPINAVFGVFNEASFREEIEVELLTIDGQPFRGSITVLEAKHGIFRDCLGFKDFANFDGVRLLFKGIYSATFKLKEPINVDGYYEMRNFDYNRRTKKNGKVEMTTIKCIIKGLRQVTTTPRVTERQDDGTTKVFIEGCEYRVSEQCIIDALSNWGELVSVIKEELFHDPHDSEGTNRTGNYSVKMKLNSKIPQILPLWGKRVKIFHKGINKLCTCCFGQHQRSQCKAEKVSWAEYVANFAEAHPTLTQTFFGRWWDMTKKHGNEKPRARPTPEEFGIPKSEEQFNKLMVEMMKTGLSYDLAQNEIQNRQENYKRALDSYTTSH